MITMDMAMAIPTTVMDMATTPTMAGAMIHGTGARHGHGGTVPPGHGAGEDGTTTGTTPRGIPAEVGIPVTMATIPAGQLLSAPHRRVHQ